MYFDNVYVYGRPDAPMTESTPIRPTSRKGRLRAELLRMLEAARDERGLDLTIARAADFYGPGATTSVFNMFVIDRVAAGEAADVALRREPAARHVVHARHRRRTGRARH